MGKLVRKRAAKTKAASRAKTTKTSSKPRYTRKKK